MITKSTYVESIDLHKWIVTAYRVFGLTIYKRSVLQALLHQYPDMGAKV